MKIYVIEWMTVRHPQWSPLVREVYTDVESANDMVRVWVRAMPPDTEFRVAEYVRK